MKTKNNKVNQVFSYNAPKAVSVLLAGDFTEWRKNAIALKPQGDGMWKAIAQLKPGTYHYRFVVDGEWQDDPECAARVPNPFGTQDAIRVVNAHAA